MESYRSVIDEMGVGVSKDDRLDVRRIYEATEGEGTDTCAACTEFFDGMESGLKIQDNLSVERTMARDLETVDFVDKIYEYFMYCIGESWYVES